MPFGLPAIGETNWGQKILDSINAVKATADANLPVFDVVAYGAAVDGITNDTAAWQAALDAAAAAGGGRIISSRSGVSIIAGALQDPAGANAQLLLPTVPLSSEQITIAIEGSATPSVIPSVMGATPAPEDHLILKSTLNAGAGGAVLGGQDTGGQFINVTLQLRNLTVRLPDNPVLTAFNLSRVACVDIDKVTADTGAYYLGSVTQPTTATSWAFRLPKNDNGAYVRLGAVNAIGFYNGFEVFEHTSGEYLAAWACRRAFVFGFSNHASKFQRIMTVHCEYGMVFTGSHYVDVDQFDIERTDTTWKAAVNAIDDPNNYGKGVVRWHSVKAGVGPESVFVKNGGASIHAVQLGQTGDTGRRDITSLMPSATKASYPNMRLYVRRSNKRVTYSLVDTAGVTGNVSVLDADGVPVGFSNPDLQTGASRIAAAPLFNNNTGHVVSAAGLYFSTALGLQIYGAPSPSVPVLAQMSFDTDDAWPTTLPGTA